MTKCLRQGFSCNKAQLIQNTKYFLGRSPAVQSQGEETSCVSSGSMGFVSCDEFQQIHDPLVLTVSCPKCVPPCYRGDVDRAAFPLQALEGIHVPAFVNA